MSRRTFLVTGGLGFLGAPLIRALVGRGHQVRVLDNSSRGQVRRLEDISKEIELVSGDIRDPDTVLRGVQGVDTVCHLAFVNGTENFYKRPAHVLDVAIKGMMNVIDSSIRAGVRELILASSSEVYQSPPYFPTDELVPLSVPNPHNPRYSYGAGKIITELMAINYGREHFERVVIFRPHNVFGPDMGWDHVIPQLTWRLIKLKTTCPEKKVALPIHGTGNQSRSFIYIEDFIAGLILVIEHGEHLNIYNIGTSEEIVIRDLAHAIGRCLGIEVQIVPGPEVEGEPLRRLPDIRKIQRLGFQTRFQLEDGLRPTVDWCMKHAPPEGSASAIEPTSQCESFDNLSKPR